MLGEVDCKCPRRPHRAFERRRSSLFEHAERLDDDGLVSELSAEKRRRERTSGTIRRADERDSIHM